MSLLGTGASF